VGESPAIYAIPGFSEPVSCLSHLLGAGLFAVLGVVLVWRDRRNIETRSWGRTISLAVFALGSVFLLAMSGVYHLLSPGGAARVVLQRLDHAAIFALIAATFTPPHAILFRGVGRWGTLLLMWAMVATLIPIKTVFFDDVPQWLGLVFYLGLGWVGLLSGAVLWRRYGFVFVRPLVAGGLAYTVGAVIDYTGEPTIIPGVIGPHELFHFAVLAGIALHWRFINRVARIAGPTPVAMQLPCCTSYCPPTRSA